MGLVSVFPGQGSQMPGMGKTWHEEFAVARELFELASDSLGIDFKKLCFEADENELAKTENTQPSLFLVGCIGFKILEQELGFKPIAVAGHSLGEYVALANAGAISFEDGIKTVRRRGELMALAAGGSRGGMMAVLGMTPPEVDLLCTEARNGEVLVPANFNAPGQVVISGDAASLDRAQEILRSKKKKGIRLKVSGAFHSPLMEKAATGLADFLAGINFNSSRFPVISNLEAKPYPGPDSARDLLIKQVTSPVRWEESVRYLNESNPGLFIEIGPGQVLSGLIRRILPEAKVCNFCDARDLNQLAAILS